MNQPTPTPELVALLDRVENLVYEASRAYHDSTRWSEEPYVYGDDNGPTWQDAIDKGFTDLRDALTRAAAQPQGDQDALDARRYRWLRENDMFDPASQSPELSRAFSRYTGDALDAAIDAAMTPPPAELGEGDSRG